MPRTATRLSNRSNPNPSTRQSARTNSKKARAAILAKQKKRATDKKDKKTKRKRVSFKDLSPPSPVADVPVDVPAHDEEVEEEYEWEDDDINMPALVPRNDEEIIVEVAPGHDKSEDEDFEEVNLHDPELFFDQATNKTTLSPLSNSKQEEEEFDFDSLLTSIEKADEERSSDKPVIDENCTGNSDSYVLNQKKQLELFVQFLSKCKCSVYS